MTEQMKQARDEKARTYGYNNAIYIDKAMLSKEGYQYLEGKPAKDFTEGTDWYRNNVWHDISEEVDISKYVLLYDERHGHLSPPCRSLSRNMSALVSEMNRRNSAFFTKWAYKDDLLPDENI